MGYGLVAALRELEEAKKKVARLEQEQDQEEVSFEKSWRQEIATEEGMLHGVDAYNDAMGYSLGGGEEHGHHCHGTGCPCMEF